ncbi:hypothetical protein E1287_26300 [Actinomadura sp. KC06]|uniref:hypothetical protein n=1 Tax=Actinomadura sp. KC06 TaxID=2530369 RepID=UPI0010441DA3|nr:hypothetical protein [Actinomadura sp. KC06]TDD31431.1 hypothetical protein E1287_26300 [Actinomadura sp. KC06]
MGRRQYQYLDADGELLASVKQIEGGRPPGKLGRMFAVERDRTRTVLEAVSPDGTPIFAIERPGKELDNLSAPIVYFPDGSRAGRIHSDPLVDGRGHDRWRIMQDRWQLRDANDAVQGVAEQRIFKKTGLFRAPSHSDKVDYSDPSGTRIAHFDGKRLDINFPLPDVLQLLVVATPIAFDLLDGA